MDPINNKERSSSFIQFLIIYILSTAFIITAIYFNSKFSVKENEILREENKKLEKLDELRLLIQDLNKDLKNMESLTEVTWMKSKDAMKEKMNNKFNLSQPNKEFKEMQLLVETLDSTFNNAVYDKLSFIKSRECVNKQKDAEGKLEGLTEKYNKLEKDYKSLEESFENYKRAN